MGVTTEMTFIFKREKHARWAAYIVEDILKVALAERTSLDEELGLSRYSSLMAAHFFCEEELDDYDPVEADPRCALAWMERRGTRLVVTRCADVQRSFPLLESALGDEPFPQICLAYATRFPQVPFAAYCRYEQTTSGYAQLTRAAWDGGCMRFRQNSGELPFNEKAWDTWDLLELRFYDGEWVAYEDVRSPLRRHYEELLDEAREAAAAGDTAGALYFLDAAEALPGCAELPQAAIQRGLVAEHLQRYGVERVRELWSEEVPEKLRDELVAAEPVMECPLGGGRFMLQAQDAGFLVVDTSDGSIAGEGSCSFGSGPTRIVHDYLLFSGNRYFLIDWKYVVEPPLENMW